MEVVNDAIKCQICKKILSSPVFLLCGETVCQIHVSEKKELYCQVCDVDHPIPNQGLVPNKAIEKIIQTKIDKCAFEQEYKCSLDCCKLLETILDEIDLMKKDPCFFIGERIVDIKNEIDLRREELKLKIDNEAEALIKQVSEYEEECKKNLKEAEFLVKANELDAETQDARVKLKEWLNDLRILETNETKWREVKEQLQKIINNLQSKSKILKDDLMLNRTWTIRAEKKQDFIEIFKIGLDSKIVDHNLANNLLKLCEIPENQQWRLLYRASNNGFKASDFHTKCDNKSKTLTIIKSSNGNIFGGYTDASWNSNNSYYEDLNAFLFSLINLHKQPAKIKIVASHSHGIYCQPKCGPSFGSGGTELVVSNKIDNMRKGYSKLNCNFNPLSYQSNFLAGSTEFEVTDIEVFMKN